MAIPTITDELWDRIASLLPVPPRRYRYPGRRRIDDRRCLDGILYVLATGITWQELPQQLGYPSGMTCWRRLRDWNSAGVFDALHRLLLAELRQADQLDWSRSVIDAAHIRALKGGGDGRKSGRPRPRGQQAPLGLRRPRDPACGRADRRQRPRRHPTVALGGCHPWRAGQAWAAASASPDAGGGSGL
jgi:transposase